MSLVMKRKKDKAPRLIVLKKTKHIKEDDLDFAKWEILKEWYEEMKEDSDAEWVDKALQSMINSIVYQERIYFCFERDNFRELLTTDKNWGSKVGMDNNKYDYVKSEAIDRGFIQVYDDTVRPTIYKVVDSEILNMIKIESEEVQLSQVIDFVNNNKAQTDKPDGKTRRINQTEKPDVEHRTKNIEHSADENVFYLEKERDYREIENTKISFKELLVKNYSDGYVRYSQLDEIIDLAFENCDESFGSNSSTERTFKDFIESKGGQKKSAEAKKAIKNISQEFNSRLERADILRSTENIEIKSPTKTTAMLQQVKKTEDDVVVQSKTLNILKNSFGKEKMERLKMEYEKAQTEKDKQQIIAEIKYWEKLLCV